MGGVLLWDFDGTLVSRPAMWATACRAALNRLSLGAVADLDSFDAAFDVGMPWHRPEHAYPDLHSSELWWAAVRSRLATIVTGYGVAEHEADQAAREVQEDILDARGYQLFPEALDALELADQAGWRSAVVSNHVPELTQVIGRLGIGDRFSWVLASGEVGFEKPHRRIFEIALQRVGGDAVWMIGDNPDADCAGAAAVGIPAMLIRTSHPSHRPCAPDAVTAVRFIISQQQRIR